MGIYYLPPAYPVKVSEIKGWLAPGTTGLPSLLELYDDDGPNGEPGTQLASASINPSVANWYTADVSGSDIIITDGGVYVVWMMTGDGSAGLGIDQTSIASRQTWEYTGVWASYRDAEISDAMLRVSVEPYEQTSFSDDFDSYSAGVQLVVQNSTDWTTWSNLPGSGEDPFVSDAHALSGSNSVVIVANNDLVRLHGQKTTGSWGMSFQIYIPSGKAGYFNTLAGFTPNPFNWGMEVYFDAGGSGRILGGSATAVTFNWTADTWQLVDVTVDLDNDLAQFKFDGNVIHTWQWTAGASGGTSPLQLDANDFFGATANDEMYFDDYLFEPRGPITGIDDNGLQTPQEFALQQNYPNPFNPTTTIRYALKENADVTLKIYNVLGQLVKTLVNTKQTVGFKEVQWDGTNDFGVKVASGIYIYRIQANDFVQSKKMVMMK
jgi:hypothetical protein